MRLRQLLSPTHPVHLALGLTLWAGWFVVVYGGVSLACAWVPPPTPLGPFTWVNATVGALTLIMATLLAWGAWVCWRARHTGHEPVGARRFLAAVSAGLYAAAAIATLAVGLPAMRLPPCL
jgi:hypothetical protein